MNFRFELHKLRCGGRVYNFGGGSDSSSSSTSQTENIDQRLLQESGAIGSNASSGGTSSVNLSSTTNNTDASKNTVINNTLDGGAITAAFGLGDHAIDAVTSSLTGALAGAHHTAELALDGTLSMASSSQRAYADAAKMVSDSVGDTKSAYADAAKAAATAYGAANDQVATAYEGARVGNKNILIVSGMAMAAMAVAVIASRKGAH